MTIENTNRNPTPAKMGTRTGGYGWTTLAIGMALIFGIILMLPNGDGTTTRLTETTPRIDRTNVTPAPAPVPPDSQAPTAPPSAPTLPQ